MLRNLIKNAVFQVQGSAPFIRRRLEASKRSNRLTILNFHRVAPFDRSAYAPMAPDLFDQIVRFVRDKFEVLTFGSLERWQNTDKPGAIISFDDGYADFMEYSSPILRRHGVRANHNVIPGCVEKGVPPFNVLLQDFIGQTGNHKAVIQVLPSLSDGPQFGLRASRELKSKPISEQAKVMAELQPAIDASNDFSATRMMTVSDWNETAKEHEIGAHSFDHATLAVEDDSYIREDGRRCQAWLNANLGISTNIYALPNGDARNNVESLLAESGFDTVLYTGEDYATRDHLNRFTMYGDSTAELRARATGWTRS